MTVLGRRGVGNANENTNAMLVAKNPRPESRRTVEVVFTDGN